MAGKAAVQTIADGTPQTSAIQRISVNDPAKAGNNFKLAYLGESTPGVEYNRDSIETAIRNLTDAKLQPHKNHAAQVTQISENNWEISFTGVPGQSVELISLITNESSQLAGGGSLTARWNGALTSGFTGVVKNMNDIGYGPGFNFLLGSNVGIYEKLAAAARRMLMEVDGRTY